MDFKQLFLDSLLSKSGLTSLLSSRTYLPKFAVASQLTLEKLFYLQAYSDTACTYPYHYEMDTLDSYLLLHTIEGQGLLIYNDISYTLLPNTVAFIYCGLKHSISIANAASWHFNHIFINGNLLSTYYNLFTQNDGALCYLSDFSSIPNIFNQLNKQPNEHNFEQELLNSKLITELLTEVILAKQHSASKNNFIPFYIFEMKKDFENNYTHFFSLDQLALKYNMSKFQLTREFSKHIEVSPIQYLIQCRIDAAKEILWTTDKTITEIGSLVGIDNTNHFINLFRKNVGTTPLCYRKQRPQ